MSHISDINFDLDTCDTVVVEFTNLLGLQLGWERAKIKVQIV